MDLLAPMVVGGIGMGMVFVPLFDIVMAGVRPQEMGSASGVLQTVNSLGMSLGIAGIGAIFFALTSGPGASRAACTSAPRSGPSSPPWPAGLLVRASVRAAPAGQGLTFGPLAKPAPGAVCAGGWSVPRLRSGM